MKIDINRWKRLLATNRELPDDVYTKEKSEPCYLAEAGAYDREFIDFRLNSVVFYNGEKQNAINEKLKGILAFMDNRSDFEVYLAGNGTLKYNEKNVRISDRKNLDYMLLYLMNKLERREEILNAAGARTLEAYNDAPDRFLPYIAVVIDRAEIAETGENSPLSLLIPLLFNHADHGFRVITGSTKELKTPDGKRLQGTLLLEKTGEQWLRFYLDHPFAYVRADRPASSIASDPIFNDAVEYMREEKRISTAMLQQKFRIGWSKAMEIVEEMERMGMVGAPDRGERRMVVPTTDIHIVLPKNKGKQPRRKKSV